MKKVLFITAIAMFSIVGVANANLISNGDFDEGLKYWNKVGDVQVGNAASGGVADSLGMSGNYARLGTWSSEGKSQIRQDFEIAGITELTVSFNWAFAYFDNSYGADDTFLSFVRQDDKNEPAMQIKMVDLTTHGTSWWDMDAGLASGFFTKTYDISTYTTDEARLIFRLTEEADGWWCTGTESMAGIDNVSISGTAPVPEPSTMLLFGAGVLGLVGYSRKRSNKKA